MVKPEPPTATRPVALIALAALFGAIILASPVPVVAETIGRFEVEGCDDNGRCRVAFPLMDRKPLPFANDFSREWIADEGRCYDALAKADATLAKRGFVDTARVVLLSRFADTVSNSDMPCGFGLEYYLRAAHGNSVSEADRVPTSHPLYALTQYGRVSYDPVSGRKLKKSSIPGMAQSVPDCFKAGQPGIDCQPMRYHIAWGCLLTDDQRAKFLANVAWLPDGAADLISVPVKQAKAQIDLAEAKRVDSETKVAAKPAKKKDPNNPAGRPVCSQAQMEPG